MSCEITPNQATALICPCDRCAFRRAAMQVSSNLLMLDGLRTGRFPLPAEAPPQALQEINDALLVKLHDLAGLSPDTIFGMQVDETVMFRMLNGASSEALVACGAWLAMEPDPRPGDEIRMTLMEWRARTPRYTCVSLLTRSLPIVLDAAAMGASVALKQSEEHRSHTRAEIARRAGAPERAIRDGERMSDRQLVDLLTHIAHRIYEATAPWAAKPAASPPPAPSTRTENGATFAPTRPA